MSKALQLRTNGALDLILMDFHMPGIDGLAATKKIHEHPECKEIPVVVLTADALTQTQEAVQEAGIEDYLTKPIDIQKLLPILDKYLRKVS